MYWADVLRNSIEASDLLGNNRRVLLQENPLSINLVPVGLTASGDFVYWTSWQIRAIVRLNKNGMELPELVGDVTLQQAGGIYIPQGTLIFCLF